VLNEGFFFCVVLIGIHLPGGEISCILGINQQDCCFLFVGGGYQKNNLRNRLLNLDASLDS